MAKKTVTQQMKDLLSEQIKIHDGYDNAIVQAKAEYKELEIVFQQAEAELHQVHKGYVLNQLTNDAYISEKKKFAIADEKLRDAGFKLDEINQYRKEDLLELMGKMDVLASAYGKEAQASAVLLKHKTMQAKYDYLKTVHELSVAHKETWDVGDGMQALKVELGLKKYNYNNYESVFNGLMSNTFNSQQGIDITPTELSQAFLRGVMDERFLSELGIKE